METTQDIAARPAKDLPVCPVETTLTLISDKWKVLILPVLDAMWDWGENYKVKNGYPPATSK